MKRFAALLIILLGSAFTSPALDFEPSAPDPEKAKIPVSGMVFRVTGGKAPLYLCGSIHLMKEADYPLPEGYEKAYAAAEQVIMEVPPADMEPAKIQTVMMKYGFLKSGKLEDLLAAKTYAALKTWAEEKEFPIDTFAMMRPWVVSLLIAQQAYQEIGLEAEHGIDQHFSKRIKKDGKIGGGLETIDEQFKMLSGFEETVQEEMILQSINEAKKGKEELQAMLKAWRDGDGPALAKVMEEGFKDLPNVGKVLLQDRNAAWLPKIEGFLAESTPTLVLVGAGHLCGKGSLIELLTAKGFKVEQVK